MEKAALRRRDAWTHTKIKRWERKSFSTMKITRLFIRRYFEPFQIESKTILSAQNAVVRSGDLCLVKFTYIWTGVGNDDCPRFMPRVHNLAASGITFTNNILATARSSGNFPAVRCDLGIMWNEYANQTILFNLVYYSYCLMPSRR